MRKLQPRYLFLCALALASGCEEAREADLLEITSVGPAELDPGHPLVIEGGPFAIHHAVRVRLIGELARAFTPPEAISEDFPAQAISEQRIEVPLPERTLRERLGRSTFRGRIEVREDAHWDGEPGAVLGREMGVVLDFIPPRSIDASDRSLERVLGVTWAIESARGLTLATVADDGRGAQLGLAPGDVLVGDGTAHFVPGDSPSVSIGAAAITLTVSRPGAAERTLACTLGDRRQDDAARDLARFIQLAIGLVLLALLGSLPLASVDYATPRPAPGLRRPSAALIARAACSLALGYALVRLAVMGALPAVPIAIATLVGVRATLQFVDARGDVRTLPITLMSSLGLAAGLAVIPVAVGTADLAALARDGSPSVLDWPVFAQPVGPLALLLVGVSVATTRMRTFRAIVAIDDVVMLAIASMVLLEGTGLAPNGRAGVVAMSLSIALGTWLLGHVRGRAHGVPASLTIAGSIALAALALGAWTFADPSTLVRTTASETILGACVALAIFIVRRSIAPRVASRAPHALL